MLDDHYLLIYVSVFLESTDAKVTLCMKRRAKQISQWLVLFTFIYRKYGV